ncbi:hypothetical protein [Nonlabens agnitus]|uniref:Uncharacterized protein n=1 Tax=Nonlabens agnitus TaxID=870484 RepID=A0A2S9WRP0_9FLAO|nr:hypothetical protein [Nonlabens agnitus]PRP66150.1 hypothetical protein BST86_03125 [Nonlabens agnitus]
MADSKSNYNLLLAIAFVGIGSWKTYDYFNGDESMATYQVVLSILLIVLGIYQLWRWNAMRQKSNNG